MARTGIRECEETLGKLSGISVPSCTSVTEGSGGLSVFEQIGTKLDNVDQRPGSKDEFDDYADREPCLPLYISLPFNGGVKMPKGSAGQDYH